MWTTGSRDTTAALYVSSRGTLYSLNNTRFQDVNDVRQLSITLKIPTLDELPLLFIVSVSTRAPVVTVDHRVAVSMTISKLPATTTATTALSGITISTESSTTSTKPMTTINDITTMTTSIETPSSTSDAIQTPTSTSSTSSLSLLPIILASVGVALLLAAIIVAIVWLRSRKPVDDQNEIADSLHAVPPIEQSPDPISQSDYTNIPVDVKSNDDYGVISFPVEDNYNVGDLEL
jgi:hypothetical protein